MSNSLSSLNNNLAERLHGNKCIDCLFKNIVSFVSICKSFLEYSSIEEIQLIFNCPKCNKDHKKYFNKRIKNLQTRMDFLMGHY